jgi:hypothetical protein
MGNDDDASARFLWSSSPYWKRRITQADEA